jgi:hypothetical protein
MKSKPSGTDVTVEARRSYAVAQSVKLRLIFVLPFVVGGAVLWWSFQRFAPVQREADELAREVNGLDRETERLGSVGRRAEADSLAARAAAEREQLIGGEAALAEWLHDLQGAAAALALNAKAEFGTPESHAAGGLALAWVPVRIEIHPIVGAGDRRTAYQRLLEFCQYVATLPRRADLVELSVAGPDGGVVRATISLRLWATTPRT